MPPLLLLVGLGVLPGFTILQAARGAASRVSGPHPFAGPGVVAASLSLSVLLLVPAVVPLFVAGLPLESAAWTLPALMLAIAVAGMASTRRRTLTSEGSCTEWLLSSIAVAVLLPKVLAFAGGTVDDWWDLAFVRSYAEHASLSFAEPVLGTGRVHPRFAWNGWLVLQALVACFSGLDPAELQTGVLPALTCIAVVSAAALFARGLFGAHSFATCVTVLFVPVWLWGTEAVPFFTRLHQDKFVAGFVLVPVMLASALAALERRERRFLFLAAASFAAASSVHGLVFAVGVLGVATCCAVACVRAALGISTNGREIVVSSAALMAAALAAAAYPAWQAWSVHTWFAAEGISLAADDNPVVRAHLGLERLIAPGSWMYIVHPGAVFGWVASFAFVGLVFAWLRRREGAAAHLFALAVVPGALLWIPGVAALAGMMFVPWMLYRVGWLVPVPALSALFFESLRRRSGATAAVTLGVGAVIAVAMAGTTAIDRLRRDMMEHPVQRDRVPRGTELQLFRRVHEWPERGAVLASSGIATLVAGTTGRPTVATSERGTVVFAGSEVEAYRRLRDRARFFAAETSVPDRERIVRRYGVRLVVFRKRLMVDGNDRDWLWRGGPQGFLLALSPEQRSQWTHDSIVAAIPATWLIVHESSDFALVRTPYGTPEQGGEMGTERTWFEVFAPDAAEPAIPSEVLASIVGWPGARVEMRPAPLSLGSSERPVWVGGGEVWDDAPEAVELSIDLGSECIVNGIEVIPFLRTQRREVLEIEVLSAKRRLRAQDGIPLSVRLAGIRTRRVHLRVRSMVGESFAFWDVRVLGDSASCRGSRVTMSEPDIAGAEPSMSELVELASAYPHDARAVVGLARRVAVTSRADARAVLENVLRRDPLASPVWLELGLLRDADGDLKSAREAYERGMRADSNSAWAHGCFAWAELRSARPIMALFQAWRASALDARYSDAYTIMGSAFRSLHLPGMAHELFRRAIRLDKLRAWPYLELAALHEARGDSAVAVRVLQSFLKLVPDDARARAMLTRLEGAEALHPSGS